MRRIHATVLGAAMAASLLGAVPAVASPIGGSPTALRTEGFVVDMQCSSGDFALVSLSARSKGGEGVVKYRWDWTNNGTFDTPGSENPGARHQYPDEASFTARVGVRDGAGHVGADQVEFVTIECP